MAKKKITIRVEPDEVAVLGTVNDWKNVIGLFEVAAESAQSSEDKDGWREAGNWIRNWIKKAGKEIDSPSS